MSVEVENGDSRHLDEVMEIMRSAFADEYGEAWTRSQCAGILPMAGVELRLARDGDDALGFALFRTIGEESELLLLAVSPQNRRRGVGRALLGRFIEEARNEGASKVHLEVRDGNPAISIYEGAGFTCAGRRRKYYRGLNGNQYDALTFVLAV